MSTPTFRGLLPDGSLPAASKALVDAQVDVRTQQQVPGLVDGYVEEAAAPHIAAATTQADRAKTEADRARDISNIAVSDDVIAASLADDNSKAAVAARRVASEQWVQPWANAQPAQPPRWTLFRHPTTTQTATITAGQRVAVDPSLRLTVVVPPSGKLRYTLQAAARAGAGGTLRWLIRAGYAGPETIATTTAAVDYRPGPVGSEPGAPRMVTVTGELSTDAAGAPLTPGRSLVVEFAHQAINASCSTMWGGSEGPLMMVVEPVRKPTALEQQYTAAVSAAGAFNPLWLCADRKTLLGVLPGTETWRSVSWSTDDGATFQTNPYKFPNVAPQQVREAGDGEIIVAVGAFEGQRASLWRSTGWTLNKATATFTKVWEDAGADPAGRNSSWEPWSLSAWGRYVVAVPYGAQGDATMPSMGRYVWLSEDYGRTGRIVFDLAEHRPEPFRDTTDPNPYRPHLHGCAYDPWWDAIWLVGGDFAAAGTWVSLDHGDTWQEIPTQQMTTVHPMADAVLLVTDSGPSQMYRIPRTAPNALRAEPVHYLGAGLTDYGAMMYRNADSADAPVLTATVRAGTPGPGRIFATLDGRIWREIYTDTASIAQRGIRNVVGPTLSGKIFARLTRESNDPAQSYMVTLTPND